MGFVVVEVITQVHIRLASMLLLVLPCDRVTVTEDEVHLTAVATFIWSKHDCIRGAITEPALVCNKRERNLRICPSAMK